jgi:hypothetical protein
MWMGAPRSHQRTWAENEFSNAFTQRAETADGFRPSFSAHVRWCVHGAPIEIPIGHDLFILRGQLHNKVVISTGAVTGLRPTQGNENRFLSGNRSP